jgi:carbamoyltransferase
VDGETASVSGLKNMAAQFILGINAYHADAAACIVRDGKLLAAAEEERFRRVKHWAGFPSQAINYCLKEAKMTSVT